MKWVMSAALACLLLCGLAACGITTQQPTETQAITEPGEKVYTTLPAEVAIDPDFDAEALFERLEGVWDDDYETPGFVSFIYEDGKPSLCYGPYDGTNSGFGELVGGRSTGEDKTALSFIFPANTEEGYVPTVTVQIDLTDLDGGKLSMQLECFYEIGDWETYTYGGKTL